MMANKQVKEPQEHRVDDPQQAWRNFEATLHKAITTPKEGKSKTASSTGLPSKSQKVDRTDL